MFETLLFLGFPISDSYEEAILQLSIYERELFSQNSASSYLQKIENEGVSYLGKSLGSSIEMGALELSHAHISSILKKMIPDFPYEKFPLVLLAFSAPNN